MAELLTTKETLVALDNIFKTAEKYICIFTFNIKIDENYLSRLRNASKRGVEIIIVFGVGEAKQEVIDNILAIPKCTVYFKEYLHAKFFYNEKELLVGSMNLSEASAKNNFELSVLFKQEDYLNVIGKVKSEAKEIISDAKLWSEIRRANQPSQIAEVPQKEKWPAPSQKNENKVYTTHKSSNNVKLKGFCIRCKSSIKLDHTRPFCIDCYNEWVEWENDYYEEKYDHFTGEKSNGDTSMALPILGKNWKKYAKETDN